MHLVKHPKSDLLDRMHALKHPIEYLKDRIYPVKHATADVKDRLSDVLGGKYKIKMKTPLLQKGMALVLPVNSPHGLLFGFCFFGFHRKALL